MNHHVCCRIQRAITLPSIVLFSIKWRGRHYLRGALDPLPELVVNRLVKVLVSAKRTLALASHPKDGLLPHSESLHQHHRQRGFVTQIVATVL